MPPTRSRQSGAIATPRQATNTATNATPRRSGQELPEYEPPSHPLNENAQRALAKLLEQHPVKNMNQQLSKAVEILAENAGAVNESVSMADLNLTKLKAKRDKQENTTAQEQEQMEKLESNLEAMRTKVEKMTRQMDESIRKMIDGQHNLQALQDSISEVAQEAHTPGTTQRSQANTQTRSQRRRRETGIDDDEDENEDEDYQDFTPTDPTGVQTQATQHSIPPSAALKEKLDLKKDKYQSYTLKQRYAQDNGYINFKRSLHDGQHPEGDAPVPPSETWFSEPHQPPAPGITTRRTAANANANNANNDNDSDDDLAIAKETISTKCPLTLREFSEPVTSKKCPHSFEKSAIESMIQDPANTIRINGQGPANARGRTAAGDRAVQCPVPGCTSMLTLADLMVDVVLKRKIFRIQRAARMREDGEFDDDDDEDGGARREVQSIASGEEDEGGYGMDIDQFDGGAGRGGSVRWMKVERASMAPSTRR